MRTRSHIGIVQLWAIPLLYIFFLMCCHRPSNKSADTIDINADSTQKTRVLDVRFDRYENGTAYRKPEADSDFGANVTGFSSDRSHVSVENGAIRVFFPADAILGRSGVRFRVPIPNQTEYILGYRFKFDPSFDFSKGGKLPGLGGGRVNTGGNKPDGDGWSTRYMWVRDGRIILYLYHMDQPKATGEGISTGFHAKKGVWHDIVQRVKLNSGENRDGEIEIWIDGKQVLLKTDIKYRIAPKAPINRLVFETFRGGSDDTWASSTDGYIYFDSIRVESANQVLKEEQ